MEKTSSTSKAIVIDLERNPDTQNSTPQSAAEIFTPSPHPSPNNPPIELEQPAAGGHQEDLPASNAPVPAPAPVQERNFACPVPLCTRVFATQRALFGHLRTHPERQWRGAYPPPVFSRAEFAHTRLLINPEVADDHDDKQEEKQTALAPDDVFGGQVPADQPEEASQAATAEAEGATSKAHLQLDLNVEPPPELPDLNLSPPPYDAHN